MVTVFLCLLLVKHEDGSTARSQFSTAFHSLLISSIVEKWLNNLSVRGTNLSYLIHRRYRLVLHPELAECFQFRIVDSFSEETLERLLRKYASALDCLGSESLCLVFCR